jgi:hypothetical protein
MLFRKFDWKMLHRYTQILLLEMFTFVATEGVGVLKNFSEFMKLVQQWQKCV